MKLHRKNQMVGRACTCHDHRQERLGDFILIWLEVVHASKRHQGYGT